MVPVCVAEQDMLCTGALNADLRGQADAQYPNAGAGVEIEPRVPQKVMETGVVELMISSLV